MQDSEALALVAVLEAAFPRWNGGETTTRLFATKLRDLDAHDAGRGIQALVDHREDTTWPSWAEVSRWIRESRPKPRMIAEPEPEPLPAGAVRRLVERAMPRMLPRADAPGEVEAKIARAQAALEQEPA